MAYTRPLYLTNPTMKGDDVKEVQIRLNYLGYYQSGIDGEFGLGCDKAVRQFQTNNGLSSDGSCGPATYNALFSNSAIPRTLSLTNPTMKGDDVVRVQQKLKNLGYYTSSVDGEFGLGSKSAAIQFQTVNGLDPDGYFGPASHKKLMTNPKPNNSSGFTRALYLTNPTMKGDDVKKVQQRLKDLGYYTDAIDGEFGLNSDSSVRSFQGKNGLEVDGSCGPATWNKLFSSSAISNSSGSTSSGGAIGVVKKVFIDAGHGGTDPGASGNGISEKNITLSIATLLGNKLKAKGIEVKYTRTTDTYVSLSDRANAANNWGANLFISIHANAFSDSSARGTESYTTSTTNESTKNLSRCISASISSKLGIPNRGHKEANFVVLRDTIMPAVLIETAFITNASDAQLLKNRQNDFVDAIVENINSSNSSSNSGFTRALYLTNPTMKGDDVKKVQQRLKDLGYYTVAVDGEFGLNSRSAVIKFQQLNNLQVDGSCGPATWNKLFSSSAISNNTSSTFFRDLLYTVPNLTGNDVEKVQKILKDNKYYSNSINSSYDKLTTIGVQAFQSRNSLKPTGKCDTTTWNKLSSSNIIKNTTTRTPRNGDVQRLYGIITASEALNLSNKYYNMAEQPNTIGDIFNLCTTILGLTTLIFPINSALINTALWGGGLSMTILGSKANYQELGSKYRDLHFKSRKPGDNPSAECYKYILFSFSRVYIDRDYPSVPDHVNPPYDSKKWTLSAPYINFIKCSDSKESLINYSETTLNSVVSPII